MSKEEILEKIKLAKLQTTTAKNRMGCSENWYDCYYAVGATFGEGELGEMSEEMLNNLIKLAQEIADALF